MFMKTINIHEAKTHFSRIVEQAAKGETIIIAKAGRPVARLCALDTPLPSKRRRLGFLQGQIEVPRDFDRLGQEEIERQFESDE